MKFSFNRQTRFVDMETKNELVTEPWHIQKAYQRTVNSFIEHYKLQCRANNIDYVLLTTDKSLDLAMTGYLNKRTRIG